MIEVPVWHGLDPGWLFGWSGRCPGWVRLRDVLVVRDVREEVV